MNAWGGISSLQFRLPVMWTEANARGISINRLAEWLCTAPARQVGIEHRKGAIAVGQDADIIIWNNKERDLRLSDLTPELQEFMEDYIKQYVPRNRVVYHWFDVYDLEEERL